MCNLAITEKALKAVIMPIQVFSIHSGGWGTENLTSRAAPCKARQSNAYGHLG